jgi:hypothetical protein
VKRNLYFNSNALKIDLNTTSKQSGFGICLCLALLFNNFIHFNCYVDEVVSSEQSIHSQILPAEEGVPLDQIIHSEVLPAEEGVPLDQIIHSEVLPAEEGVILDQITDSEVLPPEKCISADEITPLEISTDTSAADLQEDSAENPEEMTYLSPVIATKDENLNSAIIQVRASYFRPFSHVFRKLLHGGSGVNYGLDTMIPFWNGLNVWAGVDYFSKGGSLIGIHHSVHITMIPITLGLKYIYWFNRYHGLYGGGAGKYYFVETINRVFPMHKTTHRNGLGSVFEVGNLFCFHHFVIDIFSSWSFKTMHGPHDLPPNARISKMKLGGWNIGIGLGYKF